jgi:hypothetical protein
MSEAGKDHPERDSSETVSHLLNQWEEALVLPVSISFGKAELPKAGGLAAEVREVQQQASPQGPACPRPGFNLNKRSQALRMHRRGETRDQIARSLGIPLQEVDLLIQGPSHRSRQRVTSGTSGAASDIPRLPRRFRSAVPAS